MLIHPFGNRNMFKFCLNNILTSIRQITNLSPVQVLIARKTVKTGMLSKF